MNDLQYPLNKKQRELISQGTRKKIFHGVAIAHVALIIVPFVAFTIYEWFKPAKPKTIQVTLYTPPQKVNPTPPSPQPPAVQPKPQPPKPKKKPVIKRKPKPKPKTKPKPKKHKITKPKPKKKRWKPAEKIKISKDIVKRKPSKPERTFVPLTKDQLAAQIRKNVPVTRISNKTGNYGASYESQLSSFIYRIWETPAKNLLGNKNPEVTIELDIDSAGRVKGSKILKLSGVSAMDNSVKKLLAQLSRVIPPRNGPQRIVMILEVVD
jgi:TonB family protein